MSCFFKNNSQTCNAPHATADLFSVIKNKQMSSTGENNDNVTCKQATAAENKPCRCIA